MDHIIPATSALIFVHPHASLYSGQTLLDKARVYLAISQSFKPQIGGGPGNGCQTSQAAVIFSLGSFRPAGKTGSVVERVFPLPSRRKLEGLLRPGVILRCRGVAS